MATLGELQKKFPDVVFQSCGGVVGAYKDKNVSIGALADDDVVILTNEGRVFLESLDPKKPRKAKAEASADPVDPAQADGGE